MKSLWNAIIKICLLSSYNVLGLILCLEQNKAEKHSYALKPHSAKELPADAAVVLGCRGVGTGLVLCAPGQSHPRTYRVRRVFYHWNEPWLLTTQIVLSKLKLSQWLHIRDIYYQVLQLTLCFACLFPISHTWLPYLFGSFRDGIPGSQMPSRKGLCTELTPICLKDVLISNACSLWPSVHRASTRGQFVYISPFFSFWGKIDK